MPGTPKVPRGLEDGIPEPSDLIFEYMGSIAVTIISDAVWDAGRVTHAAHALLWLAVNGIILTDLFD